jgi:hypothetical protein
MTEPVTVTNNIIGGVVTDNQGIGLYYYLYVEADDWGVATFVGDLTVTANDISIIDEDGIAMYVYAEAYENGTACVTGNVVAATNEITSIGSHGIYYYAYTDAEEYASALITSTISLTENTVFESGEDAVYVYQYVDSYDYAESAIIGKVTVNDNTLTTLDEGITVDRYAYAYDENNTADLIGDVEIMGNMINGENTDDYPIYVYYYAYAEWYGLATIVGDVTVCDNTIEEATEEWAIYVEVDADAGDDYGVVNMASDVLISGNNAEDNDGFANYDLDFEAYDYGQINFTGSLTTTENTQTVCGEGIEISREVSATEEAKIVMNMPITVSENNLECLDSYGRQLNGSYAGYRWLHQWEVV